LYPLPYPTLLRLSLIFFIATMFPFAHVHSQEFWQKTTFPGRGGRGLAVGTTGVVIAHGDSGTFRSTNEGVSWTLILANTDTSYVQTLAIHPAGSIFAGTFQGGLATGRFLRSTNDGATWIATTLPHHGYYAIAIDKNGVTYAGSEYGGIFASTNEGLDWLTTWSTNLMVWSLAVGSDLVLYAGTGDSGMYRSTDIGVTWTQNNTGLPWGLPAVFDMAIDGEGVLYAAVDSVFFLDETPRSGGIFVSSDAGVSWTARSNGLTDSRASTFAIDSSGDFYAGTWGGGAFRSTDKGSSWNAFGLTGMYVYSIRTGPDGFVYALTDSGLFRSMQTTVDVGENTSVPSTFSLAQNYPNPFNPVTTISYSLPFRSKVSLSVFDILGREVATLISGEVAAGGHSVQWSPANLPSGVYHYRLAAGEFTATKKMLLIK